MVSNKLFKILGAVLGLEALTLGYAVVRQPNPSNPVTFTNVPRMVEEVRGSWKMGEYTQGIRVMFDDYFVITDEQALTGQEGMNLAGPGVVPAGTLESFREFSQLCEKLKDKETITIQGDLKKTETGEDYTFNGKKVILLYNANYADKKIKIDRRPIDN